MRESLNCPECRQLVTVHWEDDGSRFVMPPHGSKKTPCKAIGATWKPKTYQEPTPPPEPASEPVEPSSDTPHNRPSLDPDFHRRGLEAAAVFLGLCAPHIPKFRTVEKPSRHRRFPVPR